MPRHLSCIIHRTIHPARTPGFFPRAANAEKSDAKEHNGLIFSEMTVDYMVYIHEGKKIQI